MKEGTIETLRVVKDVILHYPSLLDIPVTKEMPQNIKASRQICQADLETKRLLLEREAAKKREEKQRRKDLEREDELKKEHSKELETFKTAPYDKLRMEFILLMRTLMKEIENSRNFYQKRMPHEKIYKELKAKLK